MRTLKLIVGPVIGLIFLYLLYRISNPHEVWNALIGVKIGWIVLGVGINLISYLLRALQWKYILLEIQNIPLGSLYNAIMVGFMANGVLPARMGEVIRAYAIAKETGLRISTALASIVVSRIFDGISLLAAFLVTFIFFRFDRSVTIPAGTLLGDARTIPAGFWQGVAFVGFAIFLGASVVMALLYFSQDFICTAVKRIISPLSWTLAARAESVLRSFAEGIHVLRNKTYFAISLALGLAIWAMVIISVYPLLWSFPFGVPLPQYTPLVVTVIVALALMIPAAPGYVGTFNASCAAALLLCNPDVDINHAISFSFVIWFFQVVPVIIIGFVCLRKVKMPLLGKIEPQMKADR